MLSHTLPAYKQYVQDASYLDFKLSSAEEEFTRLSNTLTQSAASFPSMVSEASQTL
jgi:hypothetical protein